MASSSSQAAENEAIVKSYRRSRSGCFTCRLRRKKCDETRPICASCAKLGLKCDYRTPGWWQSVDQRRRQKDMIKKRIRQTKVIEKEGNMKEYMDRIRALAHKPPVTMDNGFTNPVFVEQPTAIMQPLPTPATPSESQFKIQQDSLMNGMALPPTPALFQGPTFDQGSLFPQGSVLPPPPAYPQGPVYPQEVAYPQGSAYTQGMAYPRTPALPPTPVSAPLTSPFVHTPTMPQSASFSQPLCLPHTQSFSQSSTLGPTPLPPTFTPTGMAQLPSESAQLTAQNWLPSSFTSQKSYQQPSSTAQTASSLNSSVRRPLSESLRNLISVEDRDRPLLDHFVDKVLQIVFPILGATQKSPKHISEILKLMQNNRSYLHCCLSVSAIHLKNSMRLDDQMDHDIVQHRYAAISQLSRILNRGTGHLQIMDATLGLIFFHCSVGTSDDYLPDIPWNQHFVAVSNLVKKLDCTPSQFNVSLIAWIDILGSTMLGVTPEFSHTYRTKHLSGVSSGLQQMMGCDDRVMYLISEISCLESLWIEGRVDDLSLYQHVCALNSQINWTEPVNPAVENPYTLEGAIKPEQLTKIVTALFRIAARIYAHSFLPTFDSYDPIVMSWITAMGEILQCIPPGPSGFDRCLVWPLFMAGIYSVPASLFRKTIAERVAALGFLGHFGSISRMYRVLKEFWRVADETASVPGSGTRTRKQRPAATTAAAADSTGLQADQQEQFLQPEQYRPQDQYPQQEEKNHIHWREIMRKKKWHYLLM
ncbi:C6 transcription factor rosa [Aspergillus homomorphus CBS 101889]|uniref:C6 transcription factor rosa n=1 Tax=Aspergillus homomorphus (strain CBS 101889) TaxID=1450537 RepID=A0A395HTV9_ASPHC|nr:C6 transcription factor rosa [Aspergillus homomorphus CBS 101889]RAL11392.1 C6 transcription factor rosa [Aspergillus homomorphus CBS 101889]